MKKFSILILVILLTFVSCQHKPRYWTFEKDCSEVTEIKIVDLEQSGGDHNDYENYVVIKELDIAFVEELYDDIEKIEMKEYGPTLDAPGGKCFMIVFSNGEFDLISYTEPKHFKYDYSGDKSSPFYGTLQPFNSWLRCDKESFYNLIDKYLNMSLDSLNSESPN